MVWGKRDRYYADIDITDGAFLSEKAMHWEQLTSKLVQDADIQVSRAVKTWNNVIRDHLRDEMGFRLSTGNKQVSVPVVVTDGMPPPLLLELGDTDDARVELLIRRRLFQSTEKGIISTRKSLDQITHVLRGEAPSGMESESLDTVAALLGKLNKALNEGQLPDRILGLNQDVLGAYFCRVPKVHIFWLPIAILSVSAEMSIEALTFVVLTHELAHAYTHLGFDIDGEAWDTEDFARGELELVEGLAQYYTGGVCKRMTERLPAASDCFNKMLKKQHPVYKAYQKWDHADSGECMRAFLREVSDRTRPRVVESNQTEAV